MTEWKTAKRITHGEGPSQLIGWFVTLDEAENAVAAAAKLCESGVRNNLWCAELLVEDASTEAVQRRLAALVRGEAVRTSFDSFLRWLAFVAILLFFAVTAFTFLMSLPLPPPAWVSTPVCPGETLGRCDPKIEWDTSAITAKGGVLTHRCWDGSCNIVLNPVRVYDCKSGCWVRRTATVKPVPTPRPTRIPREA